MIGTARPANHRYLTDLGAAATTYGPGLADRVAALAPEGIHAALHAAPSASLPDLVTIVGDASRVVTVIDRVGAARLGARTVDAVNDSALLEQAADLGRRGLYTPRVDHVLPLASIGRRTSWRRAAPERSWPRSPEHISTVRGLRFIRPATSSTELLQTCRPGP